MELESTPQTERLLAMEHIRGVAFCKRNLHLNCLGSTLSILMISVFYLMGPLLWAVMITLSKPVHVVGNADPHGFFDTIYEIFAMAMTTLVLFVAGGLCSFLELYGAATAVRILACKEKRVYNHIFSISYTLIRIRAVYYAGLAAVFTTYLTKSSVEASLEWMIVVLGATVGFVIGFWAQATITIIADSIRNEVEKFSEDVECDSTSEEITQSPRPGDNELART
mmetsp:Transcript_25660/g.29357  ORF Transcript_25660/g.29357 Transcript_25660/m.29357 type:complete len:224 (-) Transcript_25660:241-912(-)